MTTELQASWQIDLFGRLAKAAEAQYFTFQARVDDREALQHSLIADLLNLRVGIAITARLRDLARENSRNRSALYALVRRRYDLGARNTTLADVYLSEENFRTIEADRIGFERSIAEQSYRLDVLLGQPPGTTDPLKTSFPLLPPPRDIPLCVPAALLDRRPDLRAAERLFSAGQARVSVALADLYPDLTLSGRLGFTGDGHGPLFDAERLAGSLLAVLRARLFEGGALRANIRLKESEARELALLYAENVLEALREVETALKNEQELARELAQKEQSVKALRRAEALSEARYRAGIETLRNVLETQQRRYVVERNWLQTQQEKWQARIALYLALGGDWGTADSSRKDSQESCPSPTVLAKNREGPM